MVYFHTKNANLGKFLRALGWKLLVYFMIIWYFSAIVVNSMANLYFCGHFGKFFPFWFIAPRKIWQP
jgi:hypothetical protein